MHRERMDIFREDNEEEKEKIIVLAFEGNNTERLYFRTLKKDARFNKEHIHLHLLTRDSDNTKSAPNHVFNQLKIEAKDEYNFNETDELWMIIDRHRWKNIPEIIELCKTEGNMFVAGSNPCFEIWLLLHIKNYDEITEEERTELLKNRKISNEKRYIDKYIADILGDGYNKNNPRPERFLSHIKFAIQQAETLDADKEDFPSNLGSHIYKIAQKFIK